MTGKRTASKVAKVANMAKVSKAPKVATLAEPADFDPRFVQALLDQLQARRQAIGLSSRELDGVLGVADGLVSKWECGEKTPSLAMLVLWCQTLGCRLLIQPYRWTRVETPKDRTSLERFIAATDGTLGVEGVSLLDYQPEPAPSPARPARSARASKPRQHPPRPASDA